VRPDQGAKRIGELPVPPAVLLGDRPIVLVRQKMEHVNDVAVQHGLVGIEFQRLTMGRMGFVDRAFPG